MSSSLSLLLDPKSKCQSGSFGPFQLFHSNHYFSGQAIRTFHPLRTPISQRNLGLLEEWQKIVYADHTGWYHLSLVVAFMMVSRR